MNRTHPHAIAIPAAYDDLRERTEKIDGGAR
jgi:hypothetical protein